MICWHRIFVAGDGCSRTDTVLGDPEPRVIFAVPHRAEYSALDWNPSRPVYEIHTCVRQYVLSEQRAFSSSHGVAVYREDVRA